MDVMLLIYGDVEERGGESGCQAPDLGPVEEWKSGDDVWSEDESVSSSVSRENNVCRKISLSLTVDGLCHLRSGDVVRENKERRNVTDQPF